MIKRLRTVIMVGLAVVVGLIGLIFTDFGDIIALAGDTVTAEQTDKSEVHIRYNNLNPAEDGSGFDLNQYDVGDYFLTADTTVGDLFDALPIAKAGVTMKMLWQFGSGVNNRIWTKEQGNKFLGVPEDTDTSAILVVSTGYAFNADRYEELVREKALEPGSQIPSRFDYFIDADHMPFEKANLTLNLTYKMSDGSVVPEKDFDDYQNPRVITGYSGQVYMDTEHFLIPHIQGYTANTDKVSFVQEQADETRAKPVTITYTKNPSVPSSSETGNGVGSSSFKVYGKQKLYRYKNVDFKKNERVQKYVKKPRIYAPIFKVVGTATSKAGNPRYKLSDGTYITAKSAYVAKLYWQKMTTQTMYVTNPKGVKTHATTTFNDQISRLKQGTAVPVTKLVKVGNVTRYELPDGTYITGSKCYVTPNKPRTVIKVQGRDGRNRYSDVNLNEHLQHYKKGHIFKVTGWDYSHGWNTAVHGTKRYKVAGGYITGNPKLVKIVK
ncbi:hypothetical protein IV54_GL001247 [Levilactobacillus paucivorans]|uniref:DUF5776 domain-containing protein n=1 Tax=Levilactobacillus paucivorans TaxID=616990 RepID=A0A0R2LG32_9LACO|nr:DUF5776 domain-containing protein [Levilactobacillus paucivorans]KRN97671.1 hypothetical protein IV54_GL001247 [Levilactobacillus paucivorans]